MPGDNNNLMLIIAIAVIVLLFIHLNKHHSRPLEISHEKSCNEPFVSNFTQNITPNIDYDISQNIPPVKPDASGNTYIPNDERYSVYAGNVDNFNLGVDINDPVNNKFALQAPKDKPKLLSGDLLPGKSTNTWFDTPDVGVKLEDANLLSDATQKVGIDTVGQTRKNASYDIRGTVPCPKFVVSPWNNSTYEPDMNIRPLY